MDRLPCVTIPNPWQVNTVGTIAAHLTHARHMSPPPCATEWRVAGATTCLCSHSVQGVRVTTIRAPDCIHLPMAPKYRQERLPPKAGGPEWQEYSGSRADLFAEHAAALGSIPMQLTWTPSAARVQRRTELLCEVSAGLQWETAVDNTPSGPFPAQAMSFMMGRPASFDLKAHVSFVLGRPIVVFSL